MGVDVKTEWRPIETAPRDGSELLLAHRLPWDEEPYGIVVGYWHDEQLTFVASFGQEEIAHQPTHWMSLPQTPTK